MWPSCFKNQPPHFPQISHFFEGSHVKFMGSSSNVQFPYMHFPKKSIQFFGVDTLFNFLYKTWAPCIDFMFTCCPMSKGYWYIFPRFVNCAIFKKIQRIFHKLVILSKINLHWIWNMNRHPQCNGSALIQWAMCPSFICVNFRTY